MLMMACLTEKSRLHKIKKKKRDCGLVWRFSSLQFTFEPQEGRPEGSRIYGKVFCH